MTLTREMFEPIPCKKCGFSLTKVDHYEYDGVTPGGSYEPYYECVNWCEQDEEVDTNTEFGMIPITNNFRGSVLL